MAESKLKGWLSRLLSPSPSHSILALVAALAAFPTAWVLDAQAVPYLDSRGIEVLVEVGDEMSQTGQAMRICNENGTVRQALQLTGLAERFDHFEEVLAAVRSFL